MISLPCTCGDGKYACDFHEISECGGLFHFFYHDKAGFMRVWALKVNGDHSRRWDLRHQFRSAILGSWLLHYSHTSLGDGEILSFLVKHRILCCLCFKDMKGVQKENLEDMGGGQICVFDEHVRHIFSSLWCINEP